MIYAFKILFRMPEEQKPFWRHMKDDINMDLKETGCGLDLSGSGQGPLAVSCEHDIETSCSIKGGNSLECSVIVSFCSTENWSIVYYKTCKTFHVSQNAEHGRFKAFTLVIVPFCWPWLLIGFFMWLQSQWKKISFFIHVSWSHTEYLSVHCYYSTWTGWPEKIFTTLLCILWTHEFVLINSSNFVCV